jgi:hypothetical protein
MAKSIAQRHFLLDDEGQFLFERFLSRQWLTLLVSVEGDTTSTLLFLHLPY